MCISDYIVLQILYSIFRIEYRVISRGSLFLSSSFSPQPLNKSGDYTRPSLIYRFNIFIFLIIKLQCCTLLDVFLHIR